MRFFLSILLFLSTLSAKCMYTSPMHYMFRVYLSDKGENSYSLDKPEEFLDESSISRKQRENVAIDERDFPISEDYFRLIEKAGGKVVTFSKWMKTIVVDLQDSASIENIVGLSFVDSAKYVFRDISLPPRPASRPRLVLNEYCCEDREDSTISFFGKSEPQFLLHNAEAMYSAGYVGKGITIGVIDAGFTNYDVIPYFQYGNVWDYHDFVPTGNIFEANSHGTMVLSTMLANIPYKFMGSAPWARYVLMRSEDVTSEYMVEEDYWVRAAEHADSLGMVDIINTSLGYSSFDDETLNYKRSDLDGNTSFMSKGADIAFEKGMLVVVSAGNEGNKAWRSITPPGDAKNVITVGAVDTAGVLASFSSRGFLADKRIKPDFVSVGVDAVTIGEHGEIRTANGTSFATPFLTGLIATLWSVNPDLNRHEIIEIISECGDRSDNPNSIYGKGVIDFGLAFEKVLQTLEAQTGSFVDLIVDVKREGDSFTMSFNGYKSSNPYRFNVLDEKGKVIKSTDVDTQSIVSYHADSEVKRNNQYIYFVLNNQERRNTYTYKIKL